MNPRITRAHIAQKMAFLERAEHSVHFECFALMGMTFTMKNQLKYDLHDCPFFSWEQQKKIEGF